MPKYFTLSLVVGLFAASAQAQVPSDVMATGDGAYLQDARGVIARSGQGLCWRTGYWTPAGAVAGCDGALIPPVAKPTAPTIVPPAAQQAPVSTPPVAPPIALATPQRCDFTATLESDQTFGFDRAALNEAARKRIDSDVLPRLATCAKIEFVMVTGHTDRLGSHPYNQRLSEKRAEAVATYLRSKSVAAEMDTFGMGKTQPVQACDNRLPRAQLLECLSPNRRVTIDVRGLARN
jgi:OmpA-OmpF porin, OOP family